MTLAVSVIKRHDLGMTQQVIADLTFDSSYVLGGEPITGTMLGMRIGQLFSVMAAPKGACSFEFVPNADGRQGLLKVYRAAMRNAILGSPGLAIGSGSKAKVLIANTVPFLIDGVFASKTTAEVAFTATTHDIPADADAVQEAVYAYSILANGTVAVTMGAIASGAGNAIPPAIPKGQALLGYLRLAVAAGATSFDATTDELDEAHLTDTYINAAFPADGGKALGALTEAEQAEVATTANLSGLTVRVTAHGR